MISLTRIWNGFFSLHTFVMMFLGTVWIVFFCLLVKWCVHQILDEAMFSFFSLSQLISILNEWNGSVCCCIGSYFHACSRSSAQSWDVWGERVFHRFHLFSPWQSTSLFTVILTIIIITLKTTAKSDAWNLLWNAGENLFWCCFYLCWRLFCKISIGCFGPGSTFHLKSALKTLSKHDQPTFSRDHYSLISNF